MRADITLSFVGLKSGLFLGQGPEHAGVVLLDDLGVVAPALPEFTPLMRRIDESEIAAALPRRARDAHKGTSGRVLVIGGGPGMPGAVRLAGIAALRVGAGLVTVAAAAENLVAVTAAQPELIYLPVSRSRISTRPRARRAWSPSVPASARTAGRSGCGRNSCAFRRPWRWSTPTHSTCWRKPERLPADWIITPHPGEAARLLGVDTAAVQADRLAAVRALHARYGAVSVLKGAGTLVASGAAGVPELYICDRGNPGMATAGMGDVLTGVIAGLRAQISDSAVAARVGVLVHALAGDSAAQCGQRGLIASDVIAELRGWVNP